MPNTERVVTSSDLLSITFEPPTQDGFAFPLQEIERILREKILFRGSDYCGQWLVKVGSVFNDAPPGFAWRKWSPDQRGLGFTFGQFTSGDDTFEGRVYAAIPQCDHIDLESFADTIDHASLYAKTPIHPVANVVKMPTGFRALEAQANHMRRFMTLCAQVMQKHPGGRLYTNERNEAFREVFGREYTERSIGQLMRGFEQAGLLRKIPGTSAQGFGLAAVEWLTAEHQGLAPRSVSAAKTDSAYVSRPELSKAKPKVPVVPMLDSSRSGVTPELLAQFKAEFEKLHQMLKKRDADIATLQEANAALREALASQAAHIEELEAQLPNEADELLAEMRAVTNPSE